MAAAYAFFNTLFAFLLHSFGGLVRKCLILFNKFQRSFFVCFQKIMITKPKKSSVCSVSLLFNYL